jgi:hypothetical protein
MRDKLDFQHLIAHGIDPGMTIRRTETETPWRVQSVLSDPRALNRLVISDGSGRVVVAGLSQWFQRFIER